MALVLVLSMGVLPAMAEDAEVGTKENPNYVSMPMMLPGFVQIPAGTTVYYQYSNMFDGWVVSASGVTAIEVDGVKYTDMNMFGEIEAEIKFVSLASGLVGFVNEGTEDTFAMISHNEPAGTENNPLALEDYDNYVEIPANTWQYYCAYTPDFKGDVTISATDVVGYELVVTNMADNSTVVLAADADGNINQTFTVDTYMPLMVMVGVTGMEPPEVVITVTGPELGSAARPISVWEPVDLDLSGVEPGKEVYYSFDSSFDGYPLVVAGDSDVYVIVNGTRYDYDEEEGAVVAPLAMKDWKLDVVIGMKDVEKDEYMLDAYVDFPEGHSYNPQYLDNGENAVSIPEGMDGGYHAEYMAWGDGTLTITPDKADALSEINLYNPTTESFVSWSESTDGSVSVDVTAGDIVEITVYAAHDDNWVFSAADVVLTVDGPEAPVGSMVNPLELKDGENKLSIPENELFGYYAFYTAVADGTLTITTADATAGVVYDMMMVNGTTGESVLLSESEIEGTLSLAVSAEDVVVVVVATQPDEETLESPALDVTLNVAGPIEAPESSEEESSEEEESSAPEAGENAGDTSTENPDTGVASGVGVAMALVAVAGAVMVLESKKRA